MKAVLDARVYVFIQTLMKASESGPFNPGPYHFLYIFRKYDNILRKYICRKYQHIQNIYLTLYTHYFNYIKKLMCQSASNITGLSRRISLLCLSKSFFHLFIKAEVYELNSPPLVLTYFTIEIHKWTTFLNLLVLQTMQPRSPGRGLPCEKDEGTDEKL